MLLTAPSRACCRQCVQTRHLIGLGRLRRTPVLASYLISRGIHGENKSASHHDAPQNIRNIGIIAHVDAVCLDQPVGLTICPYLELEINNF